MKQTILFSLLMLLGSAFPQLRSETRAVIAEEGKTWWYSQKDYIESPPSYKKKQFTFGLTIRSTTEIDGEQWHNVMYVDESGNDILSFPVAYLRETEEGCYVLPGIDTQEKLKALRDEQGNLTKYGWEAYKYLVPFPEKDHMTGDFIGNEWDQTEWPALLYPRNPGVGCELSYGWMQSSYRDARYFIRIDEEGWYADDLRKYTGSYCMEWGESETKDLLTDLTLVEGVGLASPGPVGLFLFPFIWEDQTVDFRPQLSPVLEKVTDASGKVIYHSPDWDNYPSMLSDEKVWNYTSIWKQIYSGETRITSYDGYHFEGTEEIDGVEYSIYRTPEGEPYAYMRQEGPRVYVRNFMGRIGIHEEFGTGAPSKDEYQLYDFSLAVGDRFQTVAFWEVSLLETAVGTCVEAEVTDVYTKEVNGESYLYQEYAMILYDGQVAPADYMERNTVIEGIGPQRGLLCAPQLGWWVTDTSDEWWFVSSVTTKDGEMLWDDPSGVETVEADGATPASDAIYDLHGRRVANPQPGSIYIRGGKKILW